MECALFGVCGGCAWGGRRLEDQHRDKLDSVRAHFPSVDFVYRPEEGVRDKVDLVWEDGRLGLYKIATREILDIQACAMMSAELEKFFLEFRQLVPPIRKGSVRLRVSPTGQRGTWLDFANQDVKTLFEQKEYLRDLSALAFVEIGQRRKALTWVNDAPKLIDPVLRPWFETYGEGGKTIPLYGPVGGFSQTGFAANRALVEAVAGAVARSGLRSWVELFCGNGNFTLALAARGMNVEAVEMDELALAGLTRSLAEIRQHLRKEFENVTMSRADVYLKTKTLPSIGERGLLVDPPRAGLREVFSLLEGAARPPALVYVSCFTDTLLSDLERLRGLGYRLEHLEGVDQFPHSPHAEWVALLTRG